MSTQDSLAGRAPAFAIAATFTAEPLAPALEFWIRELGWSDRVEFAPYNQIFQQLLDPAALPFRNAGGATVLLVRPSDWNGAGDLETAVTQFREAVAAAAPRLAAPLFVFVCPSPLDFPAELQHRTEQRIASSLTGVAGVHMAGSDEIEALYPVSRRDDPHADSLGHIPYTSEYFAALATAIARKVHAARMTPRKVIAVDCDDTLWRGICGEDGPEGVALDPPRRALQEFLLARRDEGMLLAVVSKNNLADVTDTFRMHPEMPLRFEHFAAARINWDPKPVNLASIAADLSLGLDSFVFLDDNPKECAEVAAQCPGVLALPLPAEANEFPDFLRHIWAFDRLEITEEDRRRAERYAQEAERERARRDAGSMESFLESLQLEVAIGPMTPDQLARAAQLTQRTNQMNVSTKRRGEADIRSLLEGGRYECLTVRVRDRFGDYGLTGLVLFCVRQSALVVDTLLLSCRVLGRGVEHRVLAELGRIARERDLAAVEIPFVRSARNLPALLFLESVALAHRRQEEEAPVFRIPTAEAAACRYRPAAAPPPPAAPGAAAAVSPSRPVEYHRIATDLREPARIMRSAPAGPVRILGEKPRTDLEEKLARLWASNLGLSAIGIHDNFFDLGGHSLLAVQLLSQVREELGVELSLEVVYSGEFTIAELARAIELKEIESVAGSGYDALLAEIEGLSDEEVRALLEEEEKRAG